MRGAGSVWLALAACGWLFAGDSQTPSASVNATQTVFLEYRELGSEAMIWNLPLTIQSAPFKKEPALGLRKVLRGTLKFGSSSDQYLPFIWDYGRGKLYLDLNRNQDLTDDAGGVFTCTQPLQYANNYQTFANIRLSFKTRDGSHPALVDLNLYNYGQLTANAATRSYWAGKALLQGREWQLGIIEDAAAEPGLAEKGYLLLRPWTERDRAFNLQDGSLDGFQLCRNLFLDGQAYHLDCSYLQQGGSPRYRVALEERQAELGELKLSGKFIKRFVLPGSKFTVVMDAPEPVVKVPVGSYGQCQVQLKQGSGEAYRGVARLVTPHAADATKITATKSAILAVGGPLTNSVGVSRHGRALNLSYQLVGAGGEAYQLLGARQQPEFAAYRDGKKIASGKFEFG
jgi:hypothetical protein